jgi:hypothetical protein
VAEARFGNGFDGWWNVDRPQGEAVGKCLFVEHGNSTATFEGDIAKHSAMSE